ncbi:MAG: glucosamine-6-phosphate deaminase [Verrucomicrobiia bacterium]|jgi:glucosamine-6-phosphate deaminase
MKEQLKNGEICFEVDMLKVRVFPNQPSMAKAAARDASDYLNAALLAQNSAAIILASAASQVQFLSELITLPIDWSRITIFHMDEYLGIDENHKASFRKFLRDNVLSKIKPRTYHLIQGDAPEPLTECERYTYLLKSQPIDLCCLGIGENGHIAFNDPPVANFKDRYSVKIVKLDDACRRQQVGEGAFPDIDSVPKYALTLTVPMLVSARRMICVCPEKRKARAVASTLKGEISEKCPASILRTHKNATLYLDSDSASLL